MCYKFCTPMKWVVVTRKMAVRIVKLRLEVSAYNELRLEVRAYNELRLEVSAYNKLRLEVVLTIS